LADVNLKILLASPPQPAFNTV